MKTYDELSAEERRVVAARWPLDNPRDFVYLLGLDGFIVDRRCASVPIGRAAAPGRGLALRPTGVWEVTP